MSAISCWFLVILRSLAFLMFSMLLAGMVSSKIVRSEPETITISGLSDEVERFIGIVAGGLLQALRPILVASDYRSITYSSFNVCFHFLAIAHLVDRELSYVIYFERLRNN